MRRREFIMFLGGAAVAQPIAARAQSSDHLRHVAVLMVAEEGNPVAQATLAVIREGMAKLGWTEGRNIQFEYRWAGVDLGRIQQSAKELIALQPDVILTPGSSTATAVLLQQTHTIPIVFANIIDPVGQGFVASMSRPGGNATGLVNLETSMAGKWIELLKEMAPHLTRVVVPFNPTTSPYADLYLNYFRSVAPPFGIEIIAPPVADMAAFEALAADEAHDTSTGFVPIPSTFMVGHAADIASVMSRSRLPAVASMRTFAEAGGLASYGNDNMDNYRRAATFVDSILKGKKPSDLPVQLPTKFELVINLKAAKSLGLTVSQVLLATADQVIE
jgi:putative tryptophan/tyrosine transport system substrate-binding protein